MSIEYFGKPEPVLSNEVIEATVNSLLDAKEFRVVRRKDCELGVGFIENENPEQETVTIIIKPDEIYAGFHACHVSQRDKILSFLVSSVKQGGSSCQFDEE